MDLDLQILYWGSSAFPGVLQMWTLKLGEAKALELNTRLQSPSFFHSLQGLLFQASRYNGVMAVPTSSGGHQALG